MNEGFVIIARPEHGEFWLQYDEVCRKAFWELKWEIRLWDEKR